MTLNSDQNHISGKPSSSPSFIKLAMKNMVRKGSQSLSHLILTFFVFLIFIIAIASLGRPMLPA